MGYRIQGSFKTEQMCAEEQHVWDALKRYNFDPEQNEIRDFTPTRVLYQTYLAYAREADRQHPDSASILTERQFGVALRRVFDLDRSRHAQRTYYKERLWGYIFVRGPGSIVAYADRGNPRRKRDTSSSDI